MGPQGDRVDRARHERGARLCNPAIDGPVVVDVDAKRPKEETQVSNPILPLCQEVGEVVRKVLAAKRAWRMKHRMAGKCRLEPAIPNAGHQAG